MEWNRLREKVIEEKYPEKEEIKQLKQKYSEISNFIEKEFGVETHFAGSASRGTCMKHDSDIDIFVLFPEDVERKELEEKGLEIGKQVFRRFDGDFQVEYAEHPYTKGEIEGYEVEIVPCYDTEPGEIRSSVDRTPHHSRWVKENLDEEQRREVVILKKFLDSQGLYGSSLKTRGFSGYLCEILIEFYGDFESLVMSTAEWGETKIIDPESHHETLPEELEEKFQDEPLVVIDPVDPERNVASVLNKQNYSRFVYHCWRFRQRAGMRFFQEEEKEFSEFEIKQELKKRADFLMLEFERLEEVEDIVYPQMRKTLQRLESELEKRDFRIYESGFHVGKTNRIFFELERVLPGVEKKKGPKIFHGEDHISEFRSKYDNVFVEGDRLIAKTDREFRDAKKFLENFLEGELQEKGIPGNVADRMKNYTFADVLESDEEWLNYLGEKLRIQNKVK